jgi:hypothetical protein
MDETTRAGAVSSDTAEDGRRRRPTLRILRSAFDNAKDLVRKEIEFARAQAMRDMMVKLQSVAGLLVAAVIAFIGIVFMLVAGVEGLRLVLPAWASWLIVGGGLVLVAGAVAAVTIRGLRRPPAVAEKIRETVKEDVEWARTHLKPNGKPPTPGDD